MAGYGADGRNRLDPASSEQRRTFERHPRRQARPRRAVRHQARLDPRRNEAQLPRLRDERDRQPRPARRSRRPEAGASPHPLCDVRAEFHAGPPLQQVLAHRRRHDGQVPSARRSRHLRRARAHGAGLLDARAADRRAGQFRLGRRRSARGLPLHRGEARPFRFGPARRPRQGHGRFQAELRREGRGAGRPAGALPEPSGQWRGRHRRRHGDQHPAAQSRRDHRCAARDDGEARHLARRADGASARPRFPDRRDDSRPRRESARPTRPGAARSSCAPRSRSKSCARARTARP